MRPFRLPYSNRWVDLDSVQAIEEPAKGSIGLLGSSLPAWDIRYLVAFQDAPQVLQLSVNLVRAQIGDEGAKVEAMHAWVLAQVFTPFMEAWANGAHVAVSAAGRVSTFETLAEAGPAAALVFSKAGGSELGSFPSIST